jgi:hypothetical protein
VERASLISPISRGDEADDGIAMALLQAVEDLAEVKERIETLVNTHAMRRGVSLAA